MASPEPGLLIDIGNFVDALRNKASAEVIAEYIKYEGDELRLRYLGLAQMVALNTTIDENAAWMMELVQHMQRYYTGGD